MPADPILIRLRDERDELREELRQAKEILRSAKPKEVEPRDGQWTIWGDRLWWGLQVIPLTPKEQIIANLLLSNKFKVVTKERIYSAIYQTTSEGDCPDIKIIDVLVCKMRAKLRASGGPCCLKTIWGRGLSWEERTATQGRGEIKQLIHEVSES